MTSGQIRIAEMAVALAETRIRERLGQCGYCESGHNAYGQASLAINAAFKDVRGVFHKMRHEISDEGEGS
jgi:hypothetical protein